MQPLTSKYLRGCSLFDSCPKASDSFARLSILKAAGELRGGFRFNMGRGNLSVWYDKWFDEGLCVI